MVVDKVLKRGLDILAAAVGLLCLLPVCLAVAILVFTQMGSPVLYHQERPGLRGRKFFIHKFRTMGNFADKEGSLLPDEERLTSLGRWLRRCSLDELPQLWNVLVGEMSLVGPRPLLVEYLPLYSKEQARRHEVKPGISGWAQVNGRNAITWEDKFTLDVWYVDHWSFWLDLKILGLTVSRVLQHKNINQNGQATVEKFTGSKSDGGSV
ncbi:MAG TPA: sugar transferase [Negativicutes bacterium]|nr:sugar transferase [Negativicutes bacterium]